MNRRFITTAVLAATLGLPLAAIAAKPVVEVYKSEYCGCCKEWIKHLEASGFEVKAQNVEDTSVVREKFGMPAKYGSCHTARVNGYVVEGHVPAPEIKRLLEEKPKAVGLAVPGMPMGSPGMEGPTRHAYDVVLVKPDNAGHTVYKQYKAN